jgi:hypothetical protein
MQVTSTAFTIAEYCGQMEGGSIKVNRDYQRYDKVWPPSAKSYLMDTIIRGYPIPKISLYQITDLKSRKTVKEIVDGQQRSQTIFDFVNDDFRLTGKTDYAGKLFSQLEEDERQKVLNYQLTADIFVGATPEDIREVFRRINSYTVPLNPQEKRHAVYQGELKWFVVTLSRQYSEVLKNVGVFTERQLSRMADTALFSEFLYALDNGIESASEPKIDKFYAQHEAAINAEWEPRVTTAMNRILDWQELHGSALMKPYIFYTLLLAITHALEPLPMLNPVFERPQAIAIDKSIALANLSFLADTVAQPEHNVQNVAVHNFAQNCSKGTNRKQQREGRFEWLSRALDPQLFV